MWLDEPVKTEKGWQGKQPYVNSVLYKKIQDIVGNRKIEEYEMIAV